MSTGQIVVEYTYDAWGNLISILDEFGNNITNDTTSIAYLNPIRYRGYYYDNETGYYFLQTRYYDPSLGRFLNADGQLNGNFLGLNMYAYCENNPVNMADPMGTCAKHNTGTGFCYSCILEGKGDANKALAAEFAKQETSTAKAAEKVAAEREEAIKYLATVLVGEAGNTSYKYWKENMQATAHIMINCTYIKGVSEYATLIGVAQKRHYQGYDVGARNLKNGKISTISWDYAYELASYMIDGNYSAIPRPAGITDKHIAMWDLYDNTNKNKVISKVVYGDNYFYQEDWGYGLPAFRSR